MQVATTRARVKYGRVAWGGGGGGGEDEQLTAFAERMTKEAMESMEKPGEK
jgi:hypothetical protein